ncbi:MAG: hypothetical protein Q7S22_07175 [Candidatus Micrarchaeota archaeon]|nr:hypothetical protein [Candidatus Micrarchaeota archaeon]
MVTISESKLVLKQLDRYGKKHTIMDARLLAHIDSDTKRLPHFPLLDEVLSPLDLREVMRRTPGIKSDTVIPSDNWVVYLPQGAHFESGRDIVDSRSNLDLVARFPAEYVPEAALHRPNVALFITPRGINPTTQKDLGVEVVQGRVILHPEKVIVVENFVTDHFDLGKKDSETGLVVGVSDDELKELKTHVPGVLRRVYKLGRGGTAVVPLASGALTGSPPPVLAFCDVSYGFGAIGVSTASC